MVRSERNMSLKNPVTPPGIDAGTVRLVAQRLNHYATPGPLLLLVLTLKHTSQHCMLENLHLSQNIGGICLRGKKYILSSKGSYTLQLNCSAYVKEIF